MARLKKLMTIMDSMNDQGKSPQAIVILTQAHSWDLRHSMQYKPVALFLFLVLQNLITRTVPNSLVNNLAEFREWHEDLEYLQEMYRSFQHSIQSLHKWLKKWVVSKDFLKVSPQGAGMNFILEEFCFLQLFCSVKTQCSCTYSKGPCYPVGIVHTMCIAVRCTLLHRKKQNLLHF